MKLRAVIQAAQRSSGVIAAVLTANVAQPSQALIDAALTGEGACATEFSLDGN
jgi:hypothetical protein